MKMGLEAKFKNEVSIPIGFSSSLQPNMALRLMPRSPRFQSLSGFQVRCNMTLTEAQQKKLNVSIPIGFSSSLQLPARLVKNLSKQRFQSLSGFQVRCNFDIRFDTEDVCEVSIPIGFSSSLQPRISNLDIRRNHSFNPYRVFKFVATQDGVLYRAVTVPVSIPIGFSSSLQRSSVLARRRGCVRFQSLSGFQVRCNPREVLPAETGGSSFNPYRVFKFVATSALAVVDMQYRPVSIPIGFSSSLQQFFQLISLSRDHQVSIPIGFSSSLQPSAVSGFSAALYKVSIPIGFSSSLQRPAASQELPGIFCFNPYRVFKFVATQIVAPGGCYCTKVSIPIGFSSSLQRMAAMPLGFSLQ